MGSSSNVLFIKTLDKMTLIEKCLQKVETPLRSFLGNIVELVETIPLDVTFETFNTVTIKVNFLVVECPSVYHTIIGGPTLH